MDAGLPFPMLQRLLDHQVTRLDFAVVTHAHLDHARGAQALIDRGVPVLTPVEVIAALELTRAVELPVGEVFRHSGWTIQAVPVEHDVPNVALLIQRGGESLFYCTDTARIPVRVNPTILAVEANHDLNVLRHRVESGGIEDFIAARAVRNHQSIQSLLAWLEVQDLSRTREVHLLHLSGGSAGPDFARRVEGVVGIPTRTAP